MKSPSSRADLPQPRELALSRCDRRVPRGRENEHQQNTVICRDLDAEPIPHLQAAAYYAGHTPATDQSPEERAAFALRAKLIEEAEAADVILLGAPMYNYSVPSTLRGGWTTSSPWAAPR
jgi:NAD(P)H-dependent FMN reductase